MQLPAGITEITTKPAIIRLEKIFVLACPTYREENTQDQQKIKNLTSKLLELKDLVATGQEVGRNVVLLR